MGCALTPEKHAAQRTRRAEVAREFLIDMAARPARACAASEELAQNGPRPREAGKAALPDREFLFCMAPRDRGLCASDHFFSCVGLVQVREISDWLVTS